MAVADIARFQELLTQGEIKSALVVLPQNPSLDAAAASLVLAMALEKRGYATTVSSPSPMTVEFNRLVGVNKVREDLGDKNLILSFANYPADNIEKVSYNIENGQFFLTVIPKPGNTAPGQEHILLNHAGISADMIIVVGANYPEGLGSFAQNQEFTEKLEKNLVLLGNAPLAGWPKSIELIDTSGVSISEVTHQVLQALATPLDEDLATNLFAGVAQGTNNFTAPWVKAETFALAGDLLKSGARRESAQTVVSAPQVAQPQQTRQTMPEDLSAFRDSSNIG